LSADCHAGEATGQPPPDGQGGNGGRISATLRIGRVECRYFERRYTSAFEATADGQRFLVDVAPTPQEPSAAAIILNWPVVLRKPN
jgi:hypothetical protein